MWKEIRECYVSMKFPLWMVCPLWLVNLTVDLERSGTLFTGRGIKRFAGYWNNVCSTRILIPMAIKIRPPSNSTLRPLIWPNRKPQSTPVKERKKVVKAMIQAGNQMLVFKSHTDTDSQGINTGCYTQGEQYFIWKRNGRVLFFLKRFIYHFSPR